MQKTAYEMRISDWSSDVCSSDLEALCEDRGRDDLPAGGGGLCLRGLAGCGPCRGDAARRAQGGATGAVHDRAGCEGGGVAGLGQGQWRGGTRSEEHTSELQSLMCISYAVFCLKKKRIQTNRER